MIENSLSNLAATTSPAPRWVRYEIGLHLSMPPVFRGNHVPSPQVEAVVPSTWLACPATEIIKISFCSRRVLLVIAHTRVCNVFQLVAPQLFVHAFL